MALTKVGKGGLGKGSIKDQTNLGTEAADTDEFLIYDADADALKAIQSQNVVGPGIITNKTALATAGDVANDDELLIYDTSAGVLKRVDKNVLIANQPVITSVSPTNALSGDGTGNYTFTISGSGYESSSIAFIGNDGTSYSADTVTVDSSVQITAVIAKSSLPANNEPYDVKVTNANTLTSTSADAFNIDAQPAFSTASGSLGTVQNYQRSSTTFTAVAADPESGGDITYTLESGSLPAGCSLTSTSSGAVLSGFNAVSSNTTSTFTIRAKDVNSNTNDRSFSITVNAPTVTTFNSSGTFSVPSGISAVDVLVVAGGGSGGLQHGSGGGAGGLIYRPGFPVTPSGTVTVTVGNGGPSGSGGAPNVQSGQDSVFGTLTAKGGGRGTVGNDSSGGPQPSSAGGSGGGGGYQANSTASPGNQPNQSGESGNYGFGNPGGDGTGPQGGSQSGGGGGGAGGGGGQAQTTGPSYGGVGGAGKSYSISGTATYYAGGGGGGSHNTVTGAGGAGGQGGGGSGGIYSPGSQHRATSGTANRGGGGGGDGAAISQHASDNAGGGKGVVIVSY